MGVISVSTDKETASERAGHLPMGTQLVSGGPPNPLCPGGTCQHGGCIMQTAQDGDRAGVAGEGSPGNLQPRCAERKQVACRHRLLVSQTCNSAVAHPGSRLHEAEMEVGVGDSSLTLAWEREGSEPSFHRTGEQQETAVSMWISALGGS